MKRLLILLVAFLAVNAAFSQAPNQFKYQAVLRDASGNIIASQAKAVVIDILQGSATGTSVFTETHNVTTTAQGIINLNIGSVNTTGIAAINWATNTYFIKITVGGIEMGTSQLLSVPYSLNAKNAENLSGTITKSQISDFGTYLTSYTETDPIFGAWNKSTGISITKSQITDFPLNVSSFTNDANYLTNFTELDPIFGAWNKSTGISITKSQITDFPLNVSSFTNDANYLTSFTELDPIFGAWNKSTGISITKSQITDFPVNATITVDGFMSSTDKTKLNGLTNADGSETEVTAGTNVTVTGAGTTASPYVINATSGGSGTHYLGEEYLGGIIFYLYTDNTGTQKGLIVSKTESTALWQNTGVLVNANKTSNGSYNMNLMTDSPVRTWVETLGAGWYLPSIDELSLLWHNRFHVNNSSASGLTLLTITEHYWSSTEYDATAAFVFSFSIGYSDVFHKTNSYSVRGVRAF